jgi:hypothetical protein
MAIKTFTTGEVLTAADTNTYLANSGLTYISTTSFSGANVAQFQSCFTSTYTNYRVLLNYTLASANAMYLRWLVGSTVQTGNNLSMAFGAAYSTNVYTGSTRGDQYIPIPAGYPTYPTVFTMEVFSPQTVDYTSMAINTTILGISASDSGMTIANARNLATTQINGFEITNAGGPNIAGTMTLYGYRKA